MKDIATHPVLDGQDLDAAIKHARAALAALLRAPAGGEGDTGGRTAGYLKMTTELRALLGALLDHRLALATARMDERDPVAVAGARIDRNEAIAVHAALLYRLPCHDPAWPEVAMTVGRLSYDRYSDSWPGAEPPDPDDLDAACDLFLRAVRQDEADEHTVLYLVLALRDRQRLVACPADAVALMTWGERLLAFPGAGGLGQAGLHDLLELELLDRLKAPAPASILAPHPLRLRARQEITRRFVSPARSCEYTMGTFCHICGYHTPGLPHLARITANHWTNAPITVITRRDAAY